MPARKAAALTQSVLVRFSRGNRSQRAPAAAKGVPTAMRSLGDAKQSCNSGRHLICLRFGPGKDGWRVVAYQLDHRPVPSGVCFCVAAVHAQGRRGVLARVDHQVDVALPELRKPCGVDAIQLVAVAKDTDNHRAETSLLRPLAVGGRATRASETDARAHKGVRIERHAVYCVRPPSAPSWRPRGTTKSSNSGIATSITCLGRNARFSRALTLAFLPLFEMAVFAVPDRT